MESLVAWLLFCPVFKRPQWLPQLRTLTGIEASRQEILLITFDTEKCFEDLLFDNKHLIIESLELPKDTKIFRQISLHPYGICDLLCISIHQITDNLKLLQIDLIELKNTSLKSDHLIQCARYKTFFDNLKLDSYEVEFNCHLIGMATFKTDPSDFVLLCQSIDWLSVYECFLDPLEGIKFKFTSGWGRSIEGDSRLTSFDEKTMALIEESMNGITHEVV